MLNSNSIQKKNIINPNVFIALIAIIILGTVVVSIFSQWYQAQQPVATETEVLLNGSQALQTRITMQNHTMIFVNNPATGECGFEVFKKQRLLTPQNPVPCTPENALKWLKENKSKLSIPERAYQFFTEHISAVTGVKVP